MRIEERGRIGEKHESERGRKEERMRIEERGRIEKEKVELERRRIEGDKEV